MTAVRPPSLSFGVFATVTESKASSSVTIAVGSPRSQVRDDAPTRPAEAALNRTGKFFTTSAEEV